MSMDYRNIHNLSAQGQNSWFGWWTAGSSTGWDAGFSGLALWITAHFLKDPKHFVWRLSIQLLPTISIYWSWLIWRGWWLWKCTFQWGSKSTRKRRLRLGISTGRDHRTWERLKLWVAEPKIGIRVSSLMICWSRPQMLAMRTAMPDWSHSLWATLYLSQMVFKEGDGLKSVLRNDSGM